MNAIDEVANIYENKIDSLIKEFEVDCSNLLKENERLREELKNTDYVLREELRTSAANNRVAINLINKLAKDNEQLREFLEAMEQDATRYRWLEKRAHYREEQWVWTVWFFSKDNHLSFSAAIDAAMGKQDLLGDSFASELLR